MLDDAYEQSASEPGSRKKAGGKYRCACCTDRHLVEGMCKGRSWQLDRVFLSVFYRFGSRMVQWLVDKGRTPVVCTNETAFNHIAANPRVPGLDGEGHGLFMESGTFHRSDAMMPNVWQQNYSCQSMEPLRVFFLINLMKLFASLPIFRWQLQQAGRAEETHCRYGCHGTVHLNRT